MPRPKRLGAALVEFAVSLPILLIFVAGTIEITSLIYTRQSLKIAAYEGCRLGVLPGCSESDLQDQVASILQARRIRDFTVSVTPSDLATLTSDQILTVRVAANAQSNLPIRGMFLRQPSVIGEVSFRGEQ
jgi:Flp pilus assembly protein TadG